MCSTYDKEGVPMKSQQYGCLKMFCTTTVDVPMRIVISGGPEPRRRAASN